MRNIVAERLNIENDVTSRAREDAGWVRGKNGGWLKPIRKGDQAAKGYQKPHHYTETLQLARKASPAAMRTLIERMGDADSRVAVMAASLVLERAWGKPREAEPEEREETHLDLSQLTASELAILVKLADRLGGTETRSSPQIEGSVPDIE
jgi:hypothetical protein